MRPASDLNKLRRAAETDLASHRAVSELSLSELDSKQLLHELQVHQVELEMQNEELQQTKLELQFSNRCLEKQVEDRTVELSNTISRLQHEIEFRKQTEEDNLKLQLQFLQAQKLESLGVLAGGIAHDFNNILTIIIGNCALIQMHPDMNTVEESVPSIQKAAERAAGLCRQMLTYVGKSGTKQSVFNLAETITDTVSMLKSSFAKNVELNSNIASDRIIIRGDVSQLRQVVMNLIINAAESIGEDQGVVDISLASTEFTVEQTEKDYMGKTIPPGKYLCLEVSDNGCGMDDQTKNRLFEPFFTTKFTGRGLGMSAVQGIISGHKGAIQVNSNTGTGTTFKVYLPIQDLEQAMSSSPQPEFTDNWKGFGTILLVEDEKQIRLIATKMLEKLGFSVIDASNGKEALELYHQKHNEITLVLTDLGMPVMDGCKLFSELKNIKPELPIIISSGFDDFDVFSRLPDADIAGLISKPYKYEQLQTILKNTLQRIHKNKP